MDVNKKKISTEFTNYEHEVHKKDTNNTTYQHKYKTSLIKYTAIYLQ